MTLRLLQATASLPGGKAGLQRISAPAMDPEPVEVFGLTFRNRLGLAAGYDKDGRCLRGLAALGFGHIEVGTVTPEPQPGNPRPRLFRLVEDEALINRMGFPSRGAVAVRRALEAGRPTGVVIGVSLGKGASTPLEEAAEDYVRLFGTFADVADYLAINVSSPNTVGLRRLQARAHLEGLLSAVLTSRRESGRPRPPVLLKIAPDLEADELEDALAAASTQGVDGIIATNTTTGRPALRSPRAGERGGLSGRPQRARTLEMVEQIAKSGGGRIPVIACGGISSPDDLRAAIDAGACLAQIYTALVYQGPGVIRRLASVSVGPSARNEEAPRNGRGPRHRRTSYRPRARGS